jgi:Zn-dependent peptidase ImmA (M78 family)
MPPDPENSKSHWSFWEEENDRPHLALNFSLPLRPVREFVAPITSVLQGWLLERWTDQSAIDYVKEFTEVDIPPQKQQPVADDYWFCENRAFGIRIDSEGWEIRGGVHFLSTWKSKTDSSRGWLLPLHLLDQLAGWLARNWYVIAYGKDLRPPRLREREVAACRAFEDARTDATSEELQELQSWWEKHAFRSADPELPNIFLERQGDDLVFSWDESPSKTRSFMIPYGTEITSARFAVPILRRFVASRIGNVEVEPKVKKRVLDVDPEVGVRAIRSTFPGITSEWLVEQRFSEEDAREMALTGTARHPVIGLLRSAQGSKIALSDFETILGMLQPNSGNCYQYLRALAKSMNANIDLREPWQSGYHLARLVRAELGQKETGYFDVDVVVCNLKIDMREATLSDPTILAACVGSPQFMPLIAINVACEDAAGLSGRRITLAHELCHLLFDRSRMRSFARFEGGAADSDRLIEMRANAFAVELLAPIKSFIKEDGALMTNEEAESLSPQLHVSTVAIRRHLQNYRNMQGRSAYQFF